MIASVRDFIMQKGHDIRNLEAKNNSASAAYSSRFICCAAPGNSQDSLRAGRYADHDRAIDDGG